MKTPAVLRSLAAGACALLLGARTPAAPGDLLWSYTTPGEVYSSVAVAADGTLYVGVSVTSGSTYSGRVLALTPGPTGATLKWSATLPDWADATPAVSADGGTVYVGCWDGRLYALNTARGATRWSYPTANYIVS